jgi:hypothetical protein
MIENLIKALTLLVIAAVSAWAGLHVNDRKNAEEARHRREVKARYDRDEADKARWRAEADARIDARSLPEPGDGTPHGVPPNPAPVRLPCLGVPVTCHGPACYYDVRSDGGACAHLGHGRGIAVPKPRR